MTGCPSFESLSLAWSERARPAHVDQCARCSAVWADLQNMREAARQLPVWTPDLATGEAALVEAALRDQLVRRQAHRRRSMIGAAGVIVAAAASALLWMVPRSSPSAAPVVAEEVAEVEATPRPTPSFRANVRGAERARFAHRLRPGAVGHDEVLELADGQIVLDVGALRADERVRVIVGDTELSLGSARVEVSAQSGALARVSILSGRAEVRPGPGQAPVELREGQVWSRPAAAQTAEQLFTSGWDALRAGEWARAEAQWAELVAAYPADPLSEDATYWRAIAASRAGSSQAARERLIELLDGYAHSSRRAEASVMLGWLELERGDRAEAERRFTAARDADDEVVRQSAEEGLARLAER